MTLWSASNIGRAIITRLEYVEQNPGRGPKGDPGGNVTAIGPWSQFSALSIPTGTNLVQTSSYDGSRDGRGAAIYALSADQSSGAKPWRKQSFNGRWFELVRPEFGVTPQMFGAKADYVTGTGVGTDDTQAFLDCVNFCATRGSNLAWPMALDGNYMITSNNVFGSWTTNPGMLLGMTITGSGMFSTSITFRPTGADGVSSYWLHDGWANGGTASITNVLLGLQVNDVSLILDARNLTTQTVGWWRQSGWGADGNPEQKWLFRQLEFKGDAARPARMADVLQIVGTSNGSENSFVSCTGRYYRSVIRCSNSQAVNHYSLGCDWELGIGSVYVYTRGGAFTSLGGSYILDNFANASSWLPGVTVAANSFIWYDGVKYQTTAGGTTGSFTITASIAGTSLIVTAGAGLAIGQIIDFSGIQTQGTTIVNGPTGGGLGTYTIDAPMTRASGSITVGTPPTHTTGSASDGGVTWDFVADESMYLLEVGGDGTGQINGFDFIQPRLELRSVRAKILKAGDLNTGSRIAFDRADAVAIKGGYRTTFEIAESGLTVSLNGGSWSPPGGYSQPITVRFGSGPDSAYVMRGPTALITLGGGILVSSVIHDLVRWKDVTSGATFQISEDAACSAAEGTSGSAAAYESPAIYLPCVMSNPINRGYGGKGQPQKKKRTWKVNFYNWPSGGNTAIPNGIRSRFKLPPGSQLVSAQAVRHGTGGSGLGLSFKLVKDTDLTTVTDSFGVAATFGAITSFAAGFNVSTPVMHHLVPATERVFRLNDASANDINNPSPNVGDELNIEFWA